MKPKSIAVLCLSWVGVLLLAAAAWMANFYFYQAWMLATAWALAVVAVGMALLCAIINWD